MTTLIMAVIALVVGFVTDVIWTQCIKSTSAGRAFAAANWTTAIYLCSIFSTYLIVEKDILAMICYGVGAYVGSYVSVKYWGH